MTLRFLAAVVLSCALSAPAWSASAPEEQLIAGFVATREALVREHKVNLDEMSKAIRAAVNESEPLLRKDEYRAALARLQALERYMPLTELPSHDVQMFLSWIYGKLGDPANAAAHTARATAMRELLRRRLGGGATPDDPVRIVMVNDITEWTRMQLARVSDVKSVADKGRELYQVTYSGRETNNQPRIAYFERDPAARAAMLERARIFDPLPVAELKPEHRAAMEQARQKRNRFLDDNSFSYMELIGKVGDAMKGAKSLAEQGQPQAALAKLKEIEAIRPLEEIPMTDLLALYSYLNGQLEMRDKQRELRTLLFGINQVIAHGGDGLTPETAVEVIAVEEEYTWLRDKRLTRVRQSLRDGPRGKMDVLTARDASGNQRDYYFDIARMWEKNALSLRQTSTRP